MTSDERLDERLREIANAGASGPSVADDVMRQIEQETVVPVSRARSWRHLMNRRHLKWIIPTTAAAAIVLAVGLWPTNPIKPQGNGIVWADVVQRFRGVQVAYAEGREYREGKLDSIFKGFIQAPNRRRMEAFGPDGKSPVYPHSVAIGGEYTTWNPVTGLCRTGSADAGESGIDSVAMYLAILGMPFGGGSAMTMEGVELSLEAAGEQQYEGQRFLRYHVMARTPEQQGVFGPELWFDPETHELRMLYMCSTLPDGTKHQEWYASVTLDPELPEGIFEPPEGLINVEDGIWPRLSPELLAVAEKYYAARASPSRYRAVITWGSKHWPRVREVRVGDRWRADRLNLVELVQNREQYDFTGTAQPFEAVWGQIADPESLLESVLMIYKGGLARLGYNYAGPNPKQASWVKHRGEMMPDDPDTHLAELAWPVWKDDELLTPLGWSVSEAPMVYALLPDDFDRPGLIGVRGELTRNDRLYEWHEYWIDPERDYLCVSHLSGVWARYEDEPEPAMHVHGREILAFGRTEAGQWYPKTLVRRTGREVEGEVKLEPSSQERYTRVMVDTTGEIDERFLEYPSSAPPLESDPPALSRWRVSDRRLKPPDLREGQ